MLLYIKDISKKQQKSILDYTLNYLADLIPAHFVKKPHFQNTSQHELIMTQQRHAIQIHSINAWKIRRYYFSVPEHEIKKSLQFFRYYERQGSFLPFYQYLFLPMMSCNTIIYTNKLVVQEQIFHLNNRCSNTFSINQMADFLECFIRKRGYSTCFIVPESL